MVLKEIIRYRYLLQQLVLRDIKKKYRRSVLGILWSVLNPLLTMTVTAMVFSTLFRFSVENYPLYLLTGQILFAFFSESTQFAMLSMIENGSLLKKIYIPKYLFPLSRVMSSCVNLLFTIPALLLIVFATGATLSVEMLLFVLPVFLLMLFCLGLGLLLATMVVYFRDVQHLYSVLLNLLSYGTPIFYPETIVPEEYRWLLDYNPLYYFLTAFRQTMYSATVPDPGLLGFCGAMSLGMLAVGYWVFRKHENHFILYV